MRKRIAHRWQLTLTLMIGTFVAVGSFWLVQVVNQAGQDGGIAQLNNEPDYIIDRFSMVRMNQDGKPAYIISGDKLTHRPIDDASDIDKPVLNSLANKQPPMNIHAETARVDQGNTRVTLNGKVDVVRPATATTQAFRLQSPTLTVYPDEQRMETAAPVELSLGETHSSGTGLKANNATLQMQMGGRGSLTLPAKTAPPARAPATPKN